MKEFRLRISKHCIEDTAKKRYRDLLNYLLKNDDEEKEAELELLREFLEKVDFRELRRLGYDGSRDVEVLIRKADSNFEIIEI
jgi:hypothetical protein